MYHLKEFSTYLKKEAHTQAIDASRSLKSAKL